MELPLESAAQKRTVLLAALAVLALISYQSGRMWLADHRLHSDRVEVIERGAALEPGYAEGWNRVGHRQQWDLENSNLEGALANYRRAVQVNPFSAHYWMDLASAEEATGNTKEAREAFERAKNVYPTSAEVAWNYGNFLLRQEDFSEGFAQIHSALIGNPQLLPLAISRSWRSNRDVNLLLDRVLPTNVDAYIEALDFFAASRQADAGLEVWRRLMGLGKPLALPRTFPFFEDLIAEERSADAVRVWKEALAAAGLPHDDPPGGSLVFNGDFSHEFENGGLGWRWSVLPGVAIDFDVAPPGFGVRSVRIDFGGGRNTELYQPAQFVPVEPGRTYRFHARIRTEGITTESGMRFFVFDPHRPTAEQLLTENLTGSHPWTAVDGNIATGPETNFLCIRLNRNPSRLFENKLSGVVWITDVSLAPAPAERGQPSR
jgi:tetratricopeptide (TPR) repeat protein